MWRRAGLSLLEGFNAYSHPIWSAEKKRGPCRRSAEAFSGLKIVLEEVCGVADMKRLNFKVRLSVMC